MTSTSYNVVKNEIHFPNGRVVSFEYPVGDAIQIGNILVVLVWPGKAIYNENVFGVDLFSNTLWQIERLYPCNVDAAYCGVHDEEGYAVVGNMKDLVLYLDPPTGKIVKRFWATQQGLKAISPGEPLI